MNRVGGLQVQDDCLLSLPEVKLGPPVALHRQQFLQSFPRLPSLTCAGLITGTWLIFLFIIFLLAAALLQQTYVSLDARVYLQMLAVAPAESFTSQACFIVAYSAAAGSN